MTSADTKGLFSGQEIINYKKITVNLRFDLVVDFHLGKSR